MRVICIGMLYCALFFCFADKALVDEWSVGNWTTDSTGLEYKLIDSGVRPMVSDSERVIVYYEYYNFVSHKIATKDTMQIILREFNFISGFELSVMKLGNKGIGFFKIPKSLADDAPDSRYNEFMLYKIEVIDCPDR